MKVTVDVSDELVAHLAEAVATRLAKREQQPELVGAGQLGVPPRTWRAAVRSGRLPGFLVGRAYLARREDALRWLEDLRVPAPQATRTEDRSSAASPTAGEDELDALLHAGRLRRIRGGRL